MGKVSDHAAADAPNTTVVGTNIGQGQPYENADEAQGKQLVEDTSADRKDQEKHLRDLGVTE